METYPRPGAYPRRPAPAPRTDDWVERVEFSIALALQLALAIVAVSALLAAATAFLFVRASGRRSARNAIRWFANRGYREREQHGR